MNNPTLVKHNPTLVKQYVLKRGRSSSHENSNKKPKKNLVYFYDNDLNNNIGAQVCPHIRFQWVDATGNQWVDATGNITKGYRQTLEWRGYSKYDDLCIGLFKNESNALKLANYIQSVVGNSAYDSRAGKKVIWSTEGGPESFYDHVRQAAALPHVTGFVFDWDRTLQVMEGMFGSISLQNWTQRLELSEEETIEALSEYHAGGSERLQELRDMFETIGDKPVTIISASRAIQNPAKDVYTAILGNWGCQKLQGMHFSQNKYQTMAALESMTPYCI